LKAHGWLRYSNAVKPVLPFLEDASIGMSDYLEDALEVGDDEDKDNAYRTLHYVLVQLSMVMAPFTPFLAEELYQKLTGGDSVHLLDWPKVGHIDELILDEMSTVRDYVNEVLSIRAKEGIKVRQPLATLRIPKEGKFVDFADVLKEELNVKKVTYDPESELELDLDITPELRREGLMREVIRFVQNARKQAGLNVDDRIELCLSTVGKELYSAIEEHSDTIESETLGKLSDNISDGYEATVKIEDSELKITLKKL
jgi:isoleucyl-tRNA synthetase